LGTVSSVCHRVRLHEPPWIRDKLSAHNDKDLLKISLPKKAEAKPKQIKVNVGSEKTFDLKAHGKAA
jgi:hypothetical protein